MKILISAGELSGDEHAASVVEALRALKTDSLELRGMGGRNLRTASVDTVVDSEVYASVMGFLPVIKALPKIFTAMNRLKSLMDDWKPDLLLLVDYPDFNLRLAKAAKKRGIPVVYYIPPTCWAWRQGRVRLINDYVTRAATIYPFEPDFYKEHNFDSAYYVGHPMCGTLAPLTDQEKLELRKRLGLPVDKKLIVLFPGSRKNELQYHLRPMVEGFQQLCAERKDLQAVLSVAPTVDSEIIKQASEGVKNLQTSTADGTELLACGDAGIIKSGTSNLQAAFCGLPFTMIYRTNPVTAPIIRKIIKIDEYSIVNIIKSGSVRELIQEEVCAETICKEMEGLLFNTEKRSRCLNNLEEVRSRLNSFSDDPLFYNSSTAAERVAKLLCSVV